MKNYIAYGSNLNVEWMEKMCPCANFVGRGFIHNARLRFRAKGYLSLEIGEGFGEVPVAIWSIDPPCEEALDNYEEFPILYRKELIEASVEGGSILGYAYIMNDDYRDTAQMPKHRYVDVVTRGYEHQNFDKKALEEAIQEIGYE